MDIKSIVVTGATSSLGTALIDECVEQNIKVLAIANSSSQRINRIPNNPLVKIVECDIDTYSSLVVDQMGSYDAFIHFAWASTQGDAARNMMTPQVKNIEYALDAVELAERLGCQVFIGAGSQAEYGRTDEILTEDTIPRPETAYGMAKLCAGQMTRLACKQKGIRHIWPRILSAYGPNCQPQTVLNYTITELLSDRRPSLSAGEQIWDFIYTGDVARALLFLAEKGQDGEIYVIGSGDARPLCEYLEVAREVVEKHVGRRVPELGLGDKPYSESTVMHLTCDISKLRSDTGYIPETSFEEGIEDTIRWIEQKI